MPPMQDQPTQFILTLSCQDRPGIVGAVASFMANQGCNIVDSQQFGDPYTSRFFMRTHLIPLDVEHSLDSLALLFKPIAEKFNMHWEIQPLEHKTRTLICVTKASHCLNAILHRYKSGKLHMEIPAIVGNHPDLEYMANWYDIPFHHLPVTPDTREEQEQQLLSLVQDLDIELVLLARYMQILTPGLCKELKGRAINIHHSFLPSFKGANPYKQAYDRGVKLIGATAHYVTEDLDEGPIIDQEVTHVTHADTPEELKLAGQDIENRVLLRALRYHIEHRVLLNNNKTIVFR